MGDVLSQKTYTVDFLTKKREKNTGELPQYYIEDNHEAIIPKEIFYRVQEEKMRRTSLRKAPVGKKGKEVKSKHSGKFALSDIMFCKECGQPYRRQIWSKYEEKKAVWRCDNRLKNGTKYCRHSPTLQEDILHEVVLEAINTILEDKGTFITAFRENVIRVIGTYVVENDATAEDQEIEKLKRKMLHLIQQNAIQKGDIDEYESEYQDIAKRIEELQSAKRQEFHAKETDDIQFRIKEIDGYINKIPCSIKEYDDGMVRKLVQMINVISESKIEICFKSGIVMERKIG